MATRTTRDQVAIVLQPVRPVIPEARVQPDQTPAGLHVAEDRTFGGLVGERLIIAENQDVDVADCVGQAAGLIGVTRGDAGSGPPGG